MRNVLPLLVVPVMAIVAWASPDRSPDLPTVSRPPLAFAQYAIVHGEVQPRPVVEATFRFTNSTDQPVRVTGLEPSCGCLRPELSGGTEDGTATVFEPQASGTFTISVETANETPGPHEYSVVVESEIDGKVHEQTVRYLLTLPEAKLTVSPQALFFYQLQAEAGEQSLELFDPRPTPARVTSARCDHPLVEADVVSGEERGLTLVKVKLAAGLEAGQTRTVLRIETDDPEYPVIRVPVVLQGPGK